MTVRAIPGRPDPSPDPAAVGGKAANLSRLAAAGAAVPPWIVVTAAPPDTALDEERLRAGLADALESEGLAGRELAVRSSAVGEDSEGASYAGLFETVLGVPGETEAVLAAVRRVRASASAERVTAYSGSAPPAIAVIVQALVDAAASGVAFTADPVTGDRDVAVVSAVRGLGEALVSGEVDAHTFRVASPPAGAAARRGARIVERTILPQERALRRSPGGGTEWIELVGGAGEAPALSDAEVLRVVGAAADLARELDGPQDVEWALEGSGPDRRLWILQARPITTLERGERRVWDNSNIVESYAGVTTPLTFSFARSVYEDVYRQFCEVMGVEADLIAANPSVFSGMIGLVRGRVYYNLLNWYRVLSLLPGYGVNRGFMERMMGVREKLAEPPEAPAPAGRVRDTGRLLRMLVRMAGASRALGRTVPAFHARLDRAIEPLADQDLTTWAPDDLLALYRRLEDELLRHWHPPLVNDFFAMIWFGVLGRLVERWLPDEPPTLVNDLLAGEGGMVSTEPARRLMALAGRVASEPALHALFESHDDPAIVARLGLRPGSGTDATDSDPVQALARELRSYLRRFGDRCANELKLETVTLTEDPTFVVSTIRSFVRQGATDPSASREREAGIRAAAERRVAERLGGVRRRAFDLVLRRARARIRDRENLRFERTRVFGLVRRIFLGFGHALHRAGRLEQPRDVFWLTTAEVFGWADGTAASTDFRALASLRREEFRRWEEGPAPPERFETFGPPGEADFASDQGPSGVPAPRAGGQLTGTGCCPGVVRARVRLVRDPREAGALEGRILVAERTDPGWTLLFPASSGILVQRGSLLSHSAIVAREMGIPCVVSIPGLMTTLEDGELVEMDGTTGVVRRLETP